MTYTLYAYGTTDGAPVWFFVTTSRSLPTLRALMRSADLAPYLTKIERAAVEGSKEAHSV